MKILILLLCCSALAGRAEARGRYELRATQVQWRRPEWPGVEKGVDARLWDRARGRVLWKRRIKDGYEAIWAANGRAVAVLGGRSIFVWRENYRLRDFKLPGGCDYLMDYPLWSSDNRRLLLRVGASGDSDVDAGPLYCLRLERWPHYKYYSAPTPADGIYGIRKMMWKNRNTAIFWRLDMSDDGTDHLSKPQLWRVP